MSKRNPNLAAPMVMAGFKTYNSPVTNEFIQTRKERERDLVKHDCIPTPEVKTRRTASEILAKERANG